MPRMPLDLGHGHTAIFTVWRPDRVLNPQYADLPDLDPAGLIIEHDRPDGTRCTGGAVTFAGDVARRLFPGDATWVVHSLDPLNISPSVLCTVCGDHGFVRDDRWIPA